MTRVLDVCLSPELIHLYDISQYHVVVIDILRATSNMVAGLHSGMEEILPLGSVEECARMKSKGYLTAGERNGLKVEEFDLGNSPYEFIKAEFKGRKIAMTTTNGTAAIQQCQAARKILIGSFLNREALTSYLQDYAENVLLLCAGWKGKVNMEDTLFAGALCSSLVDFSYNTDAPSMAQELYRSAKNEMMETFKKASHYKRLSHLYADKDVAFCLEENKCPIIPYIKEENQHIALLNL